MPELRYTIIIHRYDQSADRYTIYDDVVKRNICQCAKHEDAKRISLALNIVNDWEPISKAEHERVMRNDIRRDI
jgi:hypothetical protein